MIASHDKAAFGGDLGDATTPGTGFGVVCANVSTEAINACRRLGEELGARLRRYPASRRNERPPRLHRPVRPWLQLATHCPRVQAHGGELVDAEGFDASEFLEPYRHRDPVVADELGVVMICPTTRAPKRRCRSSARASAKFWACWFSRQFVLERAWPVPDLGGPEIELGFVADQRPPHGHGGVDELGHLRLIEVAPSAPRRLGGVPGGVHDPGLGSASMARCRHPAWWAAGKTSPPTRRVRAQRAHPLCPSLSMTTRD